MAINKSAINLFIENLRNKAQLDKKREMEDLIDLVKKLGGKIKSEYMSLDIDGKIERKGNGFIITLNKHISNEKRKK